MKCTKPGCDGTLTKMDVKCMKCGWTIEEIHQGKAKQEKANDASWAWWQVRLFGATPLGRRQPLANGERYHHIARFLQIWTILSLLSALGWLVMGISLYDKRVLDEASAISLVLTGWIYVYFLYSVVNFVRPLVDVAVNSYGNEELIKQNTEYLRQLVEIEKFKLKRSGQKPSE